MTKARLILDVILILCILAIVGVVASILWMPGSSYKGAFLPLKDTEQEIETQLRKHVQFLARDIGQRNDDSSLRRTSDYIKATMAESGYKTEEQSFLVDKHKFQNLECTLMGTQLPEEVILVGAHYDSVSGSPGANDNGSGVASTMELARLCAGKSFSKTIKFVFFANEEPPYFASKEMGSFFYAERCIKSKEKIVGLLVLETLGYYTESPNSQTYPSNFVPGYPTTGNFIAFVGNQDSRLLVEKCVGIFRSNCNFPSEGASAPNWVNGVDWSDQYWFWRYGIPAVMITDTAPFRYPHYHTMQDTPEKINYPCFARVLKGLFNVLQSLATSK